MPRSTANRLIADASGQERAQTQRQRHDRQGGVCKSGGRKDGATRNKKVVDTMYTAVAVHYPLRRIVVHARRAKMMQRWFDVRPPPFRTIAHEPQLSEPRGLERLPKDHV